MNIIKELRGTLDILNTALEGTQIRAENKPDPFAEPARINSYARSTDHEQRLDCWEWMDKQDDDGRSALMEALFDSSPSEYERLTGYLKAGDYAEFGIYADRLMRAYVGRLIARGL